MQNHLLGLVQSLYVPPNSPLALFSRALIALKLTSTDECFFASESDNQDDILSVDEPPPPETKLHARSKWRPELGDIPDWVPARLSKFYVRVQKLYTKKKAKVKHQSIPREAFGATIALDPIHL